MLVLIVAYFAFSNPFFFTLSNMWVVLGTAGILGLMALPQTFLIISGGFDVSVGSMVALSSVVVGVASAAGLGPWFGAVIALVTALVVGAINGFIIIVLGINPLITTLGTLSIVQGVAYVMANAQTFIITSQSFGLVGSGHFGPVPFTLVLFVVAFVIAVFLEKRTTVGRKIYAIGSNKDAARLSGIKVRTIPFVLYIATALSGGVGGIVVASQLSAASADVGTAYQLAVVTAVILGGTSLTGGRGSVVGTLIAVLILGVLQNGFALLGLSAYTQTIALGCALIVAVLLDQTVRSLERRSS
jgi:ribose transport system permease protein